MNSLFSVCFLGCGGEEEVESGRLRLQLLAMLLPDILLQVEGDFSVDVVEGGEWPRLQGLLEIISSGAGSAERYQVICPGLPVSGLNISSSSSLLVVPSLLIIFSEWQVPER